MVDNVLQLAVGDQLVGEPAITLTSDLIKAVAGKFTAAALSGTTITLAPPAGATQGTITVPSGAPGPAPVFNTFSQAPSGARHLLQEGSMVPAPAPSMDAWGGGFAPAPAPGGNDQQFGSQPTVNPNPILTGPIGPATATFPAGFGTACTTDVSCDEAALTLLATHWKDASLLVNSVGGASGLIPGSSNLQVVSGYVNVTLAGKQTLDNLGGSINVGVPLLPGYQVQPNQITACLRQSPLQQGNNGVAGYPQNAEDLTIAGPIVNGVVTCQSAAIGNFLVVQFTAPPPPPPPPQATPPPQDGSGGDQTPGAIPAPTASSGTSATPATAIKPDATTQPTVTFTATLTAFTVETFNRTEVKDAYKAAIQKAAGSNTYVNITSITPGSVNVGTQVYFLDGNTTAQSEFVSAVHSAGGLATILPPETYGNVTVSSVSAAGPVGSGKKDKHVGAIVGGVLGGIAGLCLLLALIVWFTRRHSAASHARAHSDATGTATTPGPQAPLTTQHDIVH
jgi:hypothetical protein